MPPIAVCDEEVTTPRRPGFQRKPDRSGPYTILSLDGDVIGQWPRLPDEAVSGVYIFRASDGSPLYVGRTVNLANRLNGHRQRTWWPTVARIEVIPIDRESILHETEAQLLQALKPLHNVVGKNADANFANIAKKRAQVHLLASCGDWRDWGERNPALLEVGDRTRCNWCQSAFVNAAWNFPRRHIPDVEAYVRAEHAAYAADPTLSARGIQEAAASLLPAGAA